MGDLPATTGSRKPRTPGDLLSTYLLASIGFACLIGWELSAVFGPALSLLSFCPLEDAVLLRIVSVFALVVSFVVFACKADWVFGHRNRILAAGSLLALAVVANTALNLMLDGIPFFVSVAAWALFGVGQACAMTYWCVYFSLIPTCRTALAISLGSIGGTVLFLSANATDAPWMNLLEIALFMAASAGFAVFLTARIPPERILPASAFRRTPILTVPAALSIGCQGAVYGFMATALCSLGHAAALVVGASGLFGAFVVLLWCRLGPKVDIDTGVVQRISLPILVGGVLLFPFFGDEGKLVCGCVVNAALAHSSIIAWYSTSIDNYEFRLHPVDRFALRQAPSSAGFLLGCILAFAVVVASQPSGAAYYLVMVVFALVVVVGFSVYGGDESRTKRRLNALLAPASMAAAAEAPTDGAGDAGAGSRPPSFKERCDRASARYGLTPREVEVFCLLAKGRNAEYIAERLVVSPATVKSHIYHIYRKLGINSQQRLMNIVDDEAGARESG